MALNKEIDFFENISSEIKNTFLQIRNALKTRETQLLRQIEVLSQHCKLNNTDNTNTDNTNTNVKCYEKVAVIFEAENDLIKSVSNFGRLDFNGLSCESEMFKIEDYQKPEIDHVLLYKYLEKTSPENTSPIINTDQHENDSEIPNTILQCIEKHDPNLCLHLPKQIDVEQETDIFNCDIKNCNLTCKCASVKNENNFPSELCEMKTVLEKVNISVENPVQVQQWMKQIISEPEIEPSPNNVMEHSHIKILHKNHIV